MVNIPEFSKYLVFVMMKKMQDEGKEMMYIVTIGRRMIRKVEIPYTWRLQKKKQLQIIFNQNLLLWTVLILKIAIF